MEIHTIDYEGAQDLKLIFTTLRTILIALKLPTLEVDGALGRINDRINEITSFENDMRTALMRSGMHIAETGFHEEPTEPDLRLIKGKKDED